MDNKQSDQEAKQDALDPLNTNYSDMSDGIQRQIQLEAIINKTEKTSGFYTNDVTRKLQS